MLANVPPGQRMPSAVLRSIPTCAAIDLMTSCSIMANTGATAYVCTFVLSTAVTSSAICPMGSEPAYSLSKKRGCEVRTEYRSVVSTRLMICSGDSPSAPRLMSSTYDKCSRARVACKDKKHGLYAQNPKYVLYKNIASSSKPAYTVFRDTPLEGDYFVASNVTATAARWERVFVFDSSNSCYDQALKYCFETRYSPRRAVWEP